MHFRTDRTGIALHAFVPFRRQSISGFLLPAIVFVHVVVGSHMYSAAAVASSGQCALSQPRLSRHCLSATLRATSSTTSTDGHLVADRLPLSSCIDGDVHTADCALWDRNRRFRTSADRNGGGGRLGHVPECLDYGSKAVYFRAVPPSSFFRLFPTSRRFHLHDDRTVPAAQLGGSGCHRFAVTVIGRSRRRQAVAIIRWSCGRRHRRSSRHQTPPHVFVVVVSSRDDGGRFRSTRQPKAGRRCQRRRERRERQDVHLYDGRLRSAFLA